MSHVICQMLDVTCHGSCVTIYVSHLMCHLFFLLPLLDKVVELIGGGSFFNGAYNV
jgi:hypothetical protein